jgi:hypothetical protein
MKEMLRDGGITGDTLVWCPEPGYSERGWVMASYTVIAMIDPPRWRQSDDSIPYTPPTPHYRPAIAREAPRASKRGVKIKNQGKISFGGIIVLAAIILGVFIFQRNFTFFVVRPEYADSGNVLLMLRTDDLRFIDSVDSLFVRQKLSLVFMGRAEILEGVTKNARIFARFPYSNWMHSLSVRR